MLKIFKIIELAFRKCGKSVEMQTPDTVTAAKENLFLILSSLPNRERILSTLSRKVFPLTNGVARHTFEEGVVGVKDLVFRSLTNVTATVDDTDFTQVSSFSSSPVVQIGITSSTPVTISVEIELQENAIWTTHSTVNRTWNATPYWFEVDGYLDCTGVRITSLQQDMSPFTVTISSGVNDRIISPMSRFEHMSLPNKRVSAGVITSYLYDRQRLPAVEFWPVPNVDPLTDCFACTVQSEMASIGELSEYLDVPDRWLDALVSKLAYSMTFVFQDMDPNKVNRIAEDSEKNVILAESEDVDGMPVYIFPDIGVYT